MDHASRPPGLLEGLAARQLHVAGIVLVLRLLLGVEVVEIPEELVEPVRGREMLVLIAQVVLPELAGRVATILEKPGDRRILGVRAQLGPRQTDLAQPASIDALPQNEGGSSGRAGLLGVVVGESHALAGDPIDVGRAISHQTVAVGTDVGDSHVVAPEDEDVGLVRRPGRGDGELGDGEDDEK